MGTTEVLDLAKTEAAYYRATNDFMATVIDELQVRIERNSIGQPVLQFDIDGADLPWQDLFDASVAYHEAKKRAVETR